MGLPFESHYVHIDGIRIHYLDEGSGAPILLVHGNLSWSYGFRKMIPPLVQAGYRCVAPDLMGFGLSDKPSEETAYTLERHVRIVTSLVRRLDLRIITTVGGDWGGPISLRYAIENRDNVAAIVILNTMVRPMRLPWSFKTIFQSGGLSSLLVRRADLMRRMVFRMGFRRDLAPEVLANYRMPHPTANSRAGIVAFPKMIPTDSGDHYGMYIQEIEDTLSSWNVPVLVLFPDKDPFFPPEEGKRIAASAANGRFHLVQDAGHFMEEDAGEEIAARIIEFLREVKVGSGQ